MLKPMKLSFSAMHQITSHIGFLITHFSNEKLVHVAFDEFNSQKEELFT